MSRDEARCDMDTGGSTVADLRSGPRLSDEALHEALSWLGEALSEVLGFRAEPRDFYFERTDEVAYATCWLVTTELRAPFALGWDAVLALKATADAPPQVTATIFMFSDGSRIGRFVHGGSDFIAMRWKGASWSAPAWMADEYGEWENVIRPRAWAAAAGALAGQPLGGDLTAGAFDPEWQLSNISAGAGRGSVIVRLLKARVGRLDDGGKSSIAAHEPPITRTWGYSGQVGRWYGTPVLPAEASDGSLAATLHVLTWAAPLFAQLHRPRAVQTSWVERDEGGAEIGAHELEEALVTDWEALRSHLLGLASGPAHTIEVHCVFVEMDTRILEADGASWAEGSAELQISVIPTRPAAESITVSYTTYIDAWLSTTYGDGFVPRDNREASSRNLPQLEAVLRALAERLDGTLRTDGSQLYPLALIPEGFRDVSALPPRGGAPRCE